MLRALKAPMHEEFFTAQCYRPVARPDWNKVRREAPLGGLIRLGLLRIISPSASLSDSDKSAPPGGFSGAPTKTESPLSGCSEGFAVGDLPYCHLFAIFLPALMKMPRFNRPLGSDDWPSEILRPLRS